VDKEVDRWLFVEVLRARDLPAVEELVSCPYCEVEVHGMMGKTQVRPVRHHYPTAQISLRTSLPKRFSVHPC
jgi:hypothetical protein